MTKKCWIDLETTGLDPDKNGTNHISGIIDINGIETEEFDYKVRPFSEDLINKESLEIQNVILEDIRIYPAAEEIYKIFIRLLEKHINKYNKTDKFFWLGYNSQFDNNFLRVWFNKLGDKYFGSWWWNPPIDVMSLAMNYLINSRSKMSNFKLHTVAREFGIEIDEAQCHAALYDIKITKKIYEKINQGTRSDTT